jgi:PAS domain S-box-containing protein
MTLLQKTLALAALPIVLQLVLFLYLADLQRQAEIESDRAANARTISESVNSITHGLTYIMSTFKVSKLWHGTADLTLYDKWVELIKNECAKLTEAVKDDRDEASALTEVKGEIAKVLADADMMARAYDTPNQSEFHRHDWTKVHDRMADGVRSCVESTFLGMAAGKSQSLDSMVASQKEFRRRIRSVLMLGLGLNLFIAVALLTIYTRQIVNRLSVLSRNSVNLAREEPLQVQLQGSDEIANLDKVLHEVSNALKDSRARNFAVIDNALDVICSIDANFRFSAVNPASMKIFENEPNELLGSRLINLIYPEDVDATLTKMRNLIGSGGETNVENRIRTLNGRIKYMDWSVRWSDSENTFFCIARDVTALKDAERARQGILQMVSHDLKSPLSTIKNFLELLETETIDARTEKGKLLLQASERSADRMLRLINELLEMERVKNESGSMQYTKTTIAQIFESAVQSMQLLEQGSMPEIVVSPTEIELSCNEDRIVQEITNLLSNAVKFAPAGLVTLSAQVEERNVVILVKDNGRGIPAEFLESIFEPFKQVEESDAKLRGGSGLGLAISKEIVVAHGGTIRAESEPGKGSLFLVSLPLKPA